MASMQKSQSLATLFQFNPNNNGENGEELRNNNNSSKPDMTTNGLNSSSKTTEQMVRSIQIDLDGDQHQLFMMNVDNVVNSPTNLDDDTDHVDFDNQQEVLEIPAPHLNNCGEDSSSDMFYSIPR